MDDRISRSYLSPLRRCAPLVPVALVATYVAVGSCLIADPYANVGGVDASAGGGAAGGVAGAGGAAGTGAGGSGGTDAAESSTPCNVPMWGLCFASKLETAATLPLVASNELLVGSVNGDAYDDVLHFNAQIGHFAGFVTTGPSALVDLGGAAYGWPQAIGQLDGSGTWEVVARVDFVEAGIGVGLGTYQMTGGALGDLTNVLPGSYRASLADFDGNGTLDYLVWGTDGVTATFRVIVYANDGSGAVGAQLAQITPSGWPVATAGDFDGDGDADLLLVHSASQPTADGSPGPATADLEFRGNDGAGVFGGAVTTSAPDTKLLAVADLDGDQRADLITTTDVGAFAVVRATGGGKFANPVAVKYSGPPATEVAVGDADGDDTPDVLTNGAGVTALFQNDGAASFTASPEWMTVDDVELATLDDDGRKDVVVLSPNKLTVYRSAQ